MRQGNENTFTFLETVLEEVLQLFPSRYVHIGGDEARLAAALQSPCWIPARLVPAKTMLASTHGRGACWCMG